jgi:dTDP-4-amino-4,6-dideoxygalactose transaminase
MNKGFNQVEQFESAIAQFYDAPYGVAVDCCTHGLELCLRYTQADKILVPKQTYLSVAMLAEKLNIHRDFIDDEWENYYYLTDKIIDAAVYWEKNSYINGTFMVLSFQFKKHLSLGRGGMILTDNKDAAKELKKMSYDGRDNNTGPWAEQNIETIGYHYYMTPETATLGLHKYNDAICTTPKKWSYLDYPILTNFKVFQNG